MGVKKVKAFFDKIKNRNIIFVFSLLLCAGVISFVAFASNDTGTGSIVVSKIEAMSNMTATATVRYKTGPEQYELSSQSEVQISQTTAQSSVKTSKTSVSKNKAKSTTVSTSKASSKKVKATKTTTVKAKKVKAATVRTTTVKTTKVHKNIKPAKKKTVTTTTTSVRKVKKKKKKTTTVKITTTAATKAYTPKKSQAQSYETRDISKENYTVKSATTGKKVKSNGFDILCQIVNGEISSSWNEEAIKAQAVAAYTYLRYCKENGITPELGVKSGYDSRIESIVKSVEGLVCTYNGTVINAVFCASSAGCTADVSNVWGGNLPYLKSVDSKYDADYDPNYGVTKTIAKADVKKILQKQGVTLSTKKKNWIKVLSNYNGKYVGNVSIDGQITLTGAKIRSLFGLKSAAFTVSYSNDYFTFTTYGYGHGVGMSQWGAQLYASKGGYKFDQILKHYYSGIKISLSQEV